MHHTFQEVENPPSNQTLETLLLYGARSPLAAYVLDITCTIVQYIWPIRWLPGEPCFSSTPCYNKQLDTELAPISCGSQFVRSFHLSTARIHCITDKKVLDPSQPAFHNRIPPASSHVDTVEPFNLSKVKRAFSDSLGLSCHPRIYCTLVARTGCNMSRSSVFRYDDTGQTPSRDPFNSPCQVPDRCLTKAYFEHEGHPMSISVPFFPCIVRDSHPEPDAPPLYTHLGVSLDYTAREACHCQALGLVSKPIVIRCGCLAAPARENGITFFNLCGLVSGALHAIDGLVPLRLGHQTRAVKIDAARNRIV